MTCIWVEGKRVEAQAISRASDNNGKALNVEGGVSVAGVRGVTLLCRCTNSATTCGSRDSSLCASGESGLGLEPSGQGSAPADHAEFHRAARPGEDIILSNRLGLIPAM